MLTDRRLAGPDEGLGTRMIPSVQGYRGESRLGTWRLTIKCLETLSRRDRRDGRTERVSRGMEIHRRKLRWSVDEGWREGGGRIPVVACGYDLSSTMFVGIGEVGG